MLLPVLVRDGVQSWVHKKGLHSFREKSYFRCIVLGGAQPIFVHLRLHPYIKASHLYDKTATVSYR